MRKVLRIILFIIAAFPLWFGIYTTGFNNKFSLNTRIIFWLVLIVVLSGGGYHFYIMQKMTRESFVILRGKMMFYSGCIILLVTLLKLILGI